MSQAGRFQLRNFRIGALPILNRFIVRMGLRGVLAEALGNAGYADVLLALLKNILTEHRALYAIREWADFYDPALINAGKLGDDRLARALDRLFAADRATLQTRAVLTVMKNFKLQLDQIHNDTTSVTVSGAYEAQDPKGIQLRRGHSKDNRPDLKQLVYSLCITADGAVPVHFKSYDGNQTDDGIHLETWQELRTLLQHPNFIYVADCKLCTSKNLTAIDRAHGLFVTIVPKTRQETSDFAEALLAGNVRWQEILRRREDEDGLDIIDSATGAYQLREGFTIYWLRSSQKKKRDQKSREERIARAVDKLEALDLGRTRGPKTDTTLRKRIDQILTQCQAHDWVRVEIKWDDHEEFKAKTRGKPTAETDFRRIVKKVPRLHITQDAEAIARSQVMDGIFPLTSNTKKTALEVYKIYKYQPHIEKRHALLKTNLEVAPVWIKKNTRIEALMFIGFLAQMVAALIERELRQKMAAKNIGALTSLPEGRPSKTPTLEQVLRLFLHQTRQELTDGVNVIQKFADPLTEVQQQIIHLLDVEKEAYCQVE